MSDAGMPSLAGADGSRRLLLQNLFIAAMIAALLGCVLIVSLPRLPDPLAQSLANKLQPPSSAHPLGTDELGRDVLSRAVSGAAPTIGVAGASIFLAAVLGGALGLLGGLAQESIAGFAIRSAVQFQLAFPGHWLALFLLALLGNNLEVVGLSLVLALWPPFCWVTMDEARSLAKRQFVIAARALGARETGICFRHIAPHMLTPIFLVALLDLQVAVTLVATLSFLGLGVHPPEPSWGGMVQEGRNYFPEAWWIIVTPTTALTAVILLAGLAGSRWRSGRGSTNVRF